MKRRYYPKTKKENYSKLFTDAEKAKLLYFESREFREFVYAYDANCPNTPLESVYRAYQTDKLQLSLF